MFFRKSILAALAAGLVYALPAPAFAAPSNLAPVPALNTGGLPPVLDVDHRRGHKHRGYRGKKRYPYYNGHRGYRNYRRGYRRYNGWWFPPAAFSFGFRVVPQRPHIPRTPPLVIVPPSGPRYAPYLSPAHYQWCDRRYRSYRAVDNSFQPYNGPRRACVSPYGP